MDDLKAKLDLSDSQLIVISVLQGVTAICAVTTLVFLIRNFMKIIVGSKKKDTLPLLAFYFLSFYIIIIRIYYAIWYLQIEANFQITPSLMPLTLKFLLGLDQTWIIVELCLRINYSISIVSST